MSPEADPSKEVQLVLTLLDKAIRQYMLYGPEHPQFSTAVSDLGARLRDFFTRNPEFSVAVKRTELEWMEKPVFHSDRKERNYVTEMYVDGVRQIQFLPTITAEELRKLVGVLGRDMEQYEIREDDTVTLLWKQGFQNFRYQTVDIYASDRLALLQQDSFVQDDKDKENQDFLQSFLSRLLQRPDAGDPPPVAGASSHHREFATDTAIPVPPPYLQKNEEEVERLASEAASLSKRDYLAEVAVVFCEVLETTSTESLFDDLLRNYLQVVADFLDHGQVNRAADWLKRLRGVQSHLGNTNLEVHRKIDEEIQTLATPQRFNALGAKVHDQALGTPEEWTQFFTYLGRGAAVAVCELLPYFHQETLHSAMAEFLIRQAPEETPTYLSYLRRPQWPVVRDMVRVLGALLEENALSSAFAHVVVHPEPQVRAEVLRAARRFDGDFSGSIFQRAVRDGDAEVRTLALRWILKNPHPRFVKPLTDAVTSDDFPARPPEEQRLYFQTLAHSAGTAAFDLFERLLHEGPSVSDFRCAVLHGIAALPGERSAKTLTELSQKWLGDRSVKDTARRLLERRDETSPEDEGD